jgi:phosphonate transport system permease protein
LIYEGIEDLEQKNFRTLKHMGASSFQAFWFALRPLARPLLISYFIFMLEYNFRSASLLGVVGAGGIGQELMYALEWRRFEYAGIIILLMICCVLFFDFLSYSVRKKMRKNREI